MDTQPTQNLLDGKVDKFNGIIIEESSLPDDPAGFEPILAGSGLNFLHLRTSLTGTLISIPCNVEDSRTSWLLDKDPPFQIVIDSYFFEGIYLYTHQEQGVEMTGKEKRCMQSISFVSYHLYSFTSCRFFNIYLLLPSLL